MLKFAIFRSMLALVVIISLFYANPGRVSAHTELVESNPLPGAVLPEAPASVTLKFNRPLSLELSRVTVLDTAGQNLALEPVQATGPDKLSLSVKVKPFSGQYTVNWAAVAAADGHVERGAFSFSAGFSSQETEIADRAAKLQNDPAVRQLVDEINGLHSHAGPDDLILKEANPGQGAVLGKAPETLALVFSQPLDHNISEVVALDKDQNILSAGESFFDPSDPSRLLVKLNQANGVYIVIYTIAPLNPETTGSIHHGAFTFVVDHAAASVGENILAEERASDDETFEPLALVNWLLAWVSATALVLLVGTVFFQLFIFRPVAGNSSLLALITGRWLLTVKICLLVLLAVTPLKLLVFALLIQEGDFNNPVLANLLLDTAFGRSVLGQLGLVIIGLLLLWFARLRSVGLVLVSLLLAVLSVGGGHVNGWLQLASAAIHLLAGGIWLGGGLFYLGLILLPVLRRGDPESRVALVLGCLDRFSPVALVSVGLLIVTGIFQTGQHLKNIDNLWSTAYGVALVIKHLLVFGMLLLSSYHVFIIKPGLKRGQSWKGLRRLNTVLRVEAGWGLLVLVCAGALSTLPPPA